MRTLAFLFLIPFAFAADPPVAAISNGVISARFYLPDSANGFYRGTRFDWSGVISHLESGGHTYYGPWFTKRRDDIRDFIYEGDDIIAGPNSATMGPVDEFRPVGFDTAKPGDTFLKIGVGLLRRPDDKPYDAFRRYEIVDHGKWTVRTRKDSIEFTHRLPAYEYRKTIRLQKNEMILSHSFKNTGSQPIETLTYNHNFLVLDKQPPGPGAVITFPFAVQSKRPPNAQLAELKGNSVVYKQTLIGKDTVFGPLEGFGDKVTDNELRIENTARKAGMSLRGDKPLRSITLWSIRSNISVEPYIALSAAPGQTFQWTTVYRYYNLD